MTLLPRSTDRRYAWLCAGIVLATIAFTIPIAESGVNDDWSYTKTALDLAQTGHLHYNGWAAAMLGAQAYWGALFIKLFGFSFLVVRLSVAPLAAACGVLLYLLHRRASLAPGLALFGSLTLVLSPVFIPNAATFMTDIPALFLFLVSIYGYVRVAEVLDMAGSSAGAFGSLRLWGWLMLGLSGGLLGGTVRQVVWFVPMLCSGYLLLRCCRSRRLCIAIVPLTITGMISLNGMLLFLAWYQDQPYALPRHASFNVLFSHANPTALLGYILAVLLQTMGIMMLPLLITLPMLYRQRLAGLWFPWPRLGSAFIIALFIWLFEWLCFDHAWLFHSGFSLYPYMYRTSPAPPASLPFIMPLRLWQAINLTVTILVCGTLALCVTTRFWPHRENAGAEQSRGQMPVVIGLLFAFSAPYAALLLWHALMPDTLTVSERYLLLVLPLATIVFLSAYEKLTRRTRLPLASWLVLSLSCFLGVASAHDYFAQLRARLSATHFLEQRGIPRTNIMAGFEYDGWTQISVAGHYNDWRIEKPPGSYIQPPKSAGFETIYLYWPYTPAVHPDYVVAQSPHPDLQMTDLPPTRYQCWLPPFHRYLCVQVMNPALAAVSRLPALPAPSASIR